MGAEHGDTATEVPGFPRLGFSSGVSVNSVKSVVWFAGLEFFSCQEEQGSPLPPSDRLRYTCTTAGSDVTAMDVGISVKVWKTLGV